MPEKEPRNGRRGRRRIVFTQEQLAQLEVAAGFGLTEAAIARVLQVSPETLYRRKKDSAPELRQAIATALERGRAKAQLQVGRALFREATKGNVRAIRWWEMTRLGYAERQSWDPGGVPTHGVLVMPGKVTEEEWSGVAQRQQTDLQQRASQAVTEAIGEDR